MSIAVCCFVREFQLGKGAGQKMVNIQLFNLVYFDGILDNFLVVFIDFFFSPFLSLEGVFST